MITINNTFLQDSGIVITNNSSIDEYSYFKDMVMYNGNVYSQYEFFKNAKVNGIVYGNQYDYYKAIGEFYNEPIYDQYSFYQNVSFDGVTPIGNKYEYYKNINMRTSLLYYSPYNIWDTNHKNIVGSTTTLIDYNEVGTKYNISNPTATSQPTLISNDPFFNNIDTLSFNGIDDFLNSTINDWRIGDTTGTIYLVFEINSYPALQFLYDYNKTSVGDRTGVYIDATQHRLMYEHFSPGGNLIFNNVTKIVKNTKYLLKIQSDGTNVTATLNNVEQILTKSGTDGIWFNSFSSGVMNQLVLMARNLTGYLNPSNGTLAFFGYFPLLSAADDNQVQQILMSNYNIKELDVIQFNPYNVWSAEFNDVVGSTTTLNDWNEVGTKYDLYNITASSQPSLNNLDLTLNNASSLSFDGVDDYLYDSVSNWRVSDNSGSFYIVFETGNDIISNQILFDSVYDVVTRFEIKITNKYCQLLIVNSGTFKTIMENRTTALATNTKYLLKISSDGSSYSISLNNINETLIFPSGTNDGTWLSYVTNNRSNITIGGRYIVGSEIPFKGKIAFVGYFPVLSASDDSLLQERLMSKYNI